jgi:hypothetical protein
LAADGKSVAWRKLAVMFLREDQNGQPSACNDACVNDVLAASASRSHKTIKVYLDSLPAEKGRQAGAAT